LAAADYGREFELREPNMALRCLQKALLLQVTGNEAGCRQTARAMRRQFAGAPESAFVEEMVRCSLLVPDPDADMPQLIELARAEAPVRPLSLYFVLGHAQYRAGLCDEAVQTLTDALARPHWPIGEADLPVLAMAHYRLGHDAEARQALEEAARHLDRWTQARYDGDGGAWVVDHGADGFWTVGWWDYLECQILYREARLLMDGAPPPDDPRLHVLRARALAALNWFDQSVAEYDAAVRLSPLDVQIRAESYRNRGSSFVDRGEWAEAAAEFASAAELEPNDADLWRCQAMAEVAAGDFDAYRRTCAAMMERFAQTTDHATAGYVLLV
jgi:tetratricopeptide (TPR) repeat protein